MNIAYLNAFEIAVKAVIQSKYDNYYAKGGGKPPFGWYFPGGLML